MTTSEAYNGILEILGKLDDNDVFALAKTVTQGLLKINNRDDAINGILKYSPDEVHILRRKILTREILFSYLDEKNVPIKLPATKNDLIDQILKFWNIHLQQDLSSFNNQTVAHLQSEEKQDGVCQLAEQFTQWFYTLMNEDEVISIEHFFPDAKLVLNIYSNNDCDSTLFEDNPEEIVQGLFQLKVQHNLFFNPNISSNGVQGQIDSHGLVLILVCGTLHMHQDCIGVFEQAFALARDPFSENHWKIKNSELHVKCKKGVVSQPMLCDSELMSKMPMLPPS